MNIKQQEYSGKNIYIFKKKIGEGTFGQVWLAEDKDHNRFAIKIFKKERFRDFVKEKECLIFVASQCDLYTVCYIDDYVRNDEPRLVMTYVGDDISKMELLELQQRKNYTDSILKDLILGLNHFHTLNINVTHQDIKENNIAYDGKRFRFIDWGGCCTQATEPCAYIGTRYTAPPELIERIHFEASVAQENYKQKNPNATSVELEILYENTFRQHVRDSHPSVYQKAHDIWSLGVVFLRWFTETNTIEEYYNFTDDDIDNRLKDVNFVISYIIKAFLDRDLSNRNKNFKEIVNVLKEGVVLSLKSENSEISYLYRYILTKKCENIDVSSFDSIISFEDPIDKKIYCIDKREIANDPKYEFDSIPNTFVNRWVDNSIIKLNDEDAEDIRILKFGVKPPDYSPVPNLAVYNNSDSLEAKRSKVAADKSYSSLEEGEIRAPKRLPPGLFSAPAESSSPFDSFKVTLASPFINPVTKPYEG
jgi:serine/threonine protein kinase